MGLQTKPAYIGTAGFQNPVENDRNLIEHTFGRSGVLRYGNFDIAAVAGVMQAQVQPGSAVILGSASTQGGYWGYSDAVENLAWPAANGSNPRWDTLIMRVIDTQYGASAAGDQLRWEILSGTAAASPVALTDTQINTSFPQPGAWMRMWDVRVPTGVTNLTTATFNRKFPYTNTTGFVLYASAVESRPAGLHRHERLMDVTTGLRYWWNGTIWILEAGQSIYSLRRGPAQAASNKLLNNVTGVQVAFTTPTLAVETNQVYYASVSAPFFSGAAGPHRFSVGLRYATAGAVIAYSEVGYTLQGDFTRRDINRIPVVFSGATPALEAFAANATGTGFDVYADPDHPFWINIESAGLATASLSV